MSKYIVLKELPQGQRVGDTVELNDDEARVFMMEEIQAVRPVDGPPSDDNPPSEEAKSRRRYNRRDLHATED